MPTTRTIRLSLVGLLVVGGALLSGCTATAASDDASSTSPSSQSVSDACKQMQPAVESLGQGMTDVTTALVSDPQGVISDLQTMSDAFDDGASRVTNTTVKSAVDEITRSFGVFADDLTAVAKQEKTVDQQALVSETTDLQNALVALGKACS